MSSRERFPAADAARVLSRARAVLLVLHEFVDGDCLGSNLAMAAALAILGRKSVVATPMPLGERLAFLPGFERIVLLDEIRPGLESFDCLCLIDCSDPRRAGLSDDEMGSMDRVVNIDHHPSNTLFGTVNYVDSGASAAAEQVRGVIRELGVALDFDMALCLYVAISTDTGGFRFDNTTARTHELAAELLRFGVQPGTVGELVHDTRTLSSLRLLQRMLETLGFAAGGRIAWVAVTRKMLEECGARDEEVEGLVAYPRMIDHVDVCFLLQEMPGGVTRVALRSKRDIDVSLVAGRLGGGGHRKAAGCLLSVGLEEARRRVRDECLRLLAGPPGGAPAGGDRDA